jgi:hypothetical protein
MDTYQTTSQRVGGYLDPIPATALTVGVLAPQMGRGGTFPGGRIGNEIVVHEIEVRGRIFMHAVNLFSRIGDHNDEKFLSLKLRYPDGFFVRVAILQAVKRPFQRLAASTLVVAGTDLAEYRPDSMLNIVRPWSNGFRRINGGELNQDDFPVDVYARRFYNVLTSEMVGPFSWESLLRQYHRPNVLALTGGTGGSVPDTYEPAFVANSGFSGPSTVREFRLNVKYAGGKLFKYQRLNRPSDPGQIDERDEAGVLRPEDDLEQHFGSIWFHVEGPNVYELRDGDNSINLFAVTAEGSMKFVDP